MTASDSVITLEYTPTLVDFAGRLSHLSGFVYLDSGDLEGSAELEIVTALPSSTHRLADYSENLSDWMTAIETELAGYHRMEPLIVRHPSQQAALPSVHWTTMHRPHN